MKSSFDVKCMPTLRIREFNYVIIIVGDNMENYKFGENTLIRSAGFNPYKLESILTNGILSKNKAEEMGISLTRNYFGYNFDDNVSMIRPFYSNSEDENSCLYTLVPKNVNIIVENQEFIYDTNEAYYNHADEVFVKGMVPKDKFVGLMIPEKYLTYELKDLPMIPLKSTSYANLRGACDELITYLEKMGYEINAQEYSDLLRELHLTITELNKDRNNEELKEDFFDIKLALNEFIASAVQDTFDNFLKTKTTLETMINYLNEKTLNLPIYGVSKQITK